jgi:hypothetical protein
LAHSDAGGGSRPQQYKRTFTAPLWFFDLANGVLAPEAGEFFLENCQFYQFTPAKKSETIPRNLLGLAAISTNQAVIWKILDRRS